MDYKKAFEKYVDFQQDLHKKNQKRIRVGLKVNILLPLVFLLLSFLTKGSKLVFLLLWVGSLFGIAFYLMYVEYTDYKLQEQLKDYLENETLETDILIGENVDRAEAIVSTTIDKIDERIEEKKEVNKQRIEAKKEEGKQMLEAGKQKVKDKIGKLKEGEDA